jgi:hypothetical protein
MLHVNKYIIHNPKFQANNRIIPIVVRFPISGKDRNTASYHWLAFKRQCESKKGQNIRETALLVSPNLPSSS